MFLQESIVFLACPAVNDCPAVSVYKTEHGFNAKGIYEFVSFASYIYLHNQYFFFVIHPDYSCLFRIYA